MTRSYPSCQVLIERRQSIYSNCTLRMVCYPVCFESPVLPLGHSSSFSGPRPTNARTFSSVPTLGEAREGEGFRFEAQAACYQGRQSSSAIGRSSVSLGWRIPSSSLPVRLMFCLAEPCQRTRTLTLVVEGRLARPAEGANAVAWCNATPRWMDGM